MKNFERFFFPALELLLDCGLMSIESRLPKRGLNIKDLVLPHPDAEIEIEQQNPTTIIDPSAQPERRMDPVSLAFERLPTTGPVNCDVLRAKVPGGWLIICEYQNGTGTFQGFPLLLPDPSYQWCT